MTCSKHTLLKNINRMVELICNNNLNFYVLLRTEIEFEIPKAMLEEKID